MVNGVDTTAEVKVLLRSDIFVSDGRIHVVLVDEVMDPRRVSSQIYRVRDATSEPPNVETVCGEAVNLFQSAAILWRKKLAGQSREHAGVTALSSLISSPTPYM
jgi:hypothetical protein